MKLKLSETPWKETITEDLIKLITRLVYFYKPKAVVLRYKEKEKWRHDSTFLAKLMYLWKFQGHNQKMRN